jgi:DNA modification methylase
MSLINNERDGSVDPSKVDRQRRKVKPMTSKLDSKDNSVDIVFTDPPYRIRLGGGSLLAYISRILPLAPKGRGKDQDGAEDRIENPDE